MRELNSNLGIKNSPSTDQTSYSGMRLRPTRDTPARKQIQQEVAPDPGTKLQYPLTGKQLAAL